MRIVFFGTPQFAVPSLESLLDLGASVVAVVTQPDRPKGRSHSSLVHPPIKVAAIHAGIPVLQPDRPTGDPFTSALTALKPDLGVVVAYGHLLRPAILAIPQRGMINVHASLLPRWRGAAPIQWAIAHGDLNTGVTIMAMEQGLDSGPMLLAKETAIGPAETGGQLTSRLASLGAVALHEAIERLRLGPVAAASQDDRLVTLAPKIGRKIARIDWSLDALQVANRIRAFDPVPGAWTTQADSEVKCFSPIVAGPGGVPGSVLALNPLLIAAGTGSVAVGEVQPAGKGRMSAEQWIRGRSLRIGERFG